MSNQYRQLELDRQLCFALYAASRAVGRAYGPLLAETGLTYPQYVTMLALWDTDGHELTMRDLGTRLHLDSGTLTPLLKRLETLGYIQRARGTADERTVVVAVTEKGMALRDEVAGVPADLLDRSGLRVNDAARLRDELVKLTELLEESETIDREDATARARRAKRPSR